MRRGRFLWTGSDAASLASTLILDAPVDPQSPWIVPTPLAREGVQAALTRRRGAAANLRVWTWEDLWSYLRRESGDGPMVLGPAGVRAVLNEAIGRAGRVARGTGPAPDLFRTPGYRRHLRSLFQRWQRAGIQPSALESAAIPTGVYPFDIAAFRAYDEILHANGLADPDRLALWGLDRLRRLPKVAWPSITILDPRADDPIVARALAELDRHAQDSRIALVADLDHPAPFVSSLALRERLLDRNYRETRVEAGSRPSGLVALATHLASDGAHSVAEANGLRIDGAPRGDGVALIVSRRVRDLLDTGAQPEDILVVVPDWDDQAESIRRTMVSWNLPVASLGPTPLAADPGLSTLLLALRLPLSEVDYEKTGLLRLLRSSRLRPAGPLSRDPRDFAIAASALQDVRAFRGLDAYRAALDRAQAAAPRAGATEAERREVEQRIARAGLAREVLDAVAAVLGALRAPAPWWVQVDRLVEVGSTLGLGVASEPAFQELQNALDDHALALDAMGLADNFWEAADFVAEVGALIAEQAIASPPPAPGCVRIATPDQIAGLSVPHLLVANMVEGTFPARPAIERDLDAQLDAQADANATENALPQGYASELSRFLHLVGAASQSLTLVYPTADESGRAMLPSAFLQDTIRALGRAADDPQVHERVSRLPAILPESLAQSSLECQVRAVDQASRGAFDTLRDLIRDPAHRPALRGTGAVLHLAAHRSMRRKWFGPYDGHLTDRRAIDRIAGEHAASPPEFSASQLESLALCPFQFFLRYVLHLSPPDDRDELDPDYAAEGSVLHAALERLHLRLRDDPGDADADPAALVRSGIRDAIEQVLAEQSAPTTKLEQVLREIDSERARRAGTRYADQFQSYLDASGPSGAHPHCLHCEVEFGTTGEGLHPPLVIGPPDQSVRLRGMIDRIDIVESDGARYFRVIDYKSGSVPSPGSEKRGLYLQLPLYVLAAERMILGESAMKPLDTGYWSLREKGYRASRAMHTWEKKDELWVEEASWPGFREALEAYVVELVGRLRAGDFPVHPRVEDCRRRCDYASVCRIGQMKRLGKVWPQEPRLADPKAKADAEGQS